MRVILEADIKKYVLKTLTEVDIFAYYFGISEVDIYRCLSDKNVKIQNPLRTDTIPSLGFMEQNGRIRAKDFGDPIYNGDCFYLVGLRYGLDCNNSRDFIKICWLIINDILDGNDEYDINNTSSRERLTKVLKDKIQDYFKSITFEQRPISQIDYDYWLPINVNPNQLHKHYTYVAKRVWINRQLFYSNSAVNPCYVFFSSMHKGLPTYTIYRPTSYLREDKFRRNHGNDLEVSFEGFEKGDILMINKSRKESISMSETLKDRQGKIIKFINYSSESVRLKENVVKFYKDRYPRIINATDTDAAGIKCANFHKEKYGFETYFSIRKDFTDTLLSEHKNTEIDNLHSFIFR
jgi:hypothetical protein